MASIRKNRSTHKAPSVESQYENQDKVARLAKQSIISPNVTLNAGSTHKIDSKETSNKNQKTAPAIHNSMTINVRPDGINASENQNDSAKEDRYKEFKEFYKRCIADFDRVKLG